MSDQILYFGTNRVVKEPWEFSGELICRREAEPAKKDAAALPYGGFLNIYQFDTTGLEEGADYSFFNNVTLIKSENAKRQCKHLAFGPVEAAEKPLSKDDPEDFMKLFGELFACLSEGKKEDPVSFLRTFQISGLLGEWESRNFSAFQGLTGAKLLALVKEKTGLAAEGTEEAADPDSVAGWSGQMLCYLQWRSGKRFFDVLEDLPLDQIERFYPHMKTLTKEQCFDVFREKIRQNGKKSWIQRKRKAAGLSQKELAEKSGVNIRTLQQYEIRDKDINRAALEKVLFMARVLSCRPEDLMEW